MAPWQTRFRPERGVASSREDAARGLRDFLDVWKNADADAPEVVVTGDEPLDFELPSAADGCANPWRRRIDTFLESPDDIVDMDQSPVVSGSSYRVEPRSVVVLFTEL